MVITTTKKNNLVETKIAGKVVSDIKPNEKKPNPKNEKSNSNKTKTKKKGFLRTTLEELKKVNWPAKNYVVTWGITVIIFTMVFSLFLGFFDNIFSSGLNYVSCTSAENSSSNTVDIDDCNKKLIENLTYQSN